MKPQTIPDGTTQRIMRLAARKTGITFAEAREIFTDKTARQLSVLICDKAKIGGLHAAKVPGYRTVWFAFVSDRDEYVEKTTKLIASKQARKSQAREARNEAIRQARRLDEVITAGASVPAHRIEANQAVSGKTIRGVCAVGDMRYAVVGDPPRVINPDECRPWDREAIK